MLSKAKMVLAAALVLGSGVATLANDRDGEEGGFVLSGSMDGVNPAYHPDMRADYAAFPPFTGPVNHFAMQTRAMQPSRRL